MYVFMYKSMYLNGICECLSVCTVNMYNCMLVCMMHACMYVIYIPYNIYVCMYVCMYVCDKLTCLLFHFV